MRSISIGCNLTKGVIGVDIGSTFSKAVIFSDSSILSWAIIPSGGNYRVAADEVVSQALGGTDISAEAIA